MAMAALAKQGDSSIRLSSYKPTKNLHIILNVNDLDISVSIDKETIEAWGLSGRADDMVLKQVEKFVDNSDMYWVRGKWETHIMFELCSAMRD